MTGKKRECPSQVELLRPSHSTGSSSTDSIPTCRICLVKECANKLVTPCYCKGSLLYVHKSCLERWLQQNRSENCEVCGCRYRMRKNSKSLWTWMKNPGDTGDKLRLAWDIGCFVVLLPLATFSTWYCVEVGLEYTTHAGGKSSNISTGLYVLSALLLVIFGAWTVLILRENIHDYLDWRKSHYDVELLLEPFAVQMEANENDNDKHQEIGQVVPDVYIIANTVRLEVTT